MKVKEKIKGFLSKLSFRAGVIVLVMSGWRETKDIKWNFTKFLIDREGNVVERFEPTATADKMKPYIEEQLKR